MGLISKAAAVVRRKIPKMKLSSNKRTSMHSGKLSRLDPGTELDPDTVWLTATLAKRGFYSSSAFHPRCIRLTSEFLSYSQTDGGALLDRIFFHDVAGLVFHGMKDEEFEQMFRGGSEFDDERRMAHDLFPELEAMQFAVCTTNSGYHKGRHFVFMASSIGEMEVWVASIVRVLRYNMGRDTSYQKMSRLDEARRYIRWMYLGDRCQLFVAVLIVLNFILNILDTQLLAEEGSAEENFLIFADTVFSYTFAVELLMNLFATWMAEFVKDPWNWFDTLVVGISMISLYLPGIPGVSVLRLLRTFRVFRLFKRIPSLKQILICLQQSVPPMCNAFAIVCLVTAIYAIMAVTFFGTMRDDLFGDFFSSLFTMFQIMTGDQWGDITRELFSQTSIPALTAIFFVSYQLLVSFVLVNVVIAVLLDEFAKAASSSKSANSSALQLYVPGNPDDRCPLESVSRDMVNFTDLDDLENRIQFLFLRVVRAADVHGGEAARLSETQLYEGFLRMGTVPPILFEGHHWQRYVVRHRLCDSAGLLGYRDFMVLVKQALRRYQLRELTSVLDVETGGWSSRRVRCALSTIKGMLVEEAQQARDFDAGDLVPNNEPGMTARPIRAATQKPLPQVLSGLLQDMQQLHQRFDQIEGDILGPDHISASQAPQPALEKRVGMVDGKSSEKETLPVVPYKKASAVDGGGAVKGVAEQTATSQLETNAAEDGPKDALWGADLFSPKLPSMPAWGQGQLPEMPELFSPKLPEMPVDFSQVSLPPMPFQTHVPAAPKTLSPLEGALTERSKVPARNLHQEGWDFFAAQQANILKDAADRVPGMGAAAAATSGITESFSSFGRTLFPWMQAPSGAPESARVAGALEISSTPKPTKSVARPRRSV